MKLISLLLVAAPLAGTLATPAVAQKSVHVGKVQDERAQDARDQKKRQDQKRAQDARDQKKDQDQKRAQDARGDKQRTDQERADAKAKREARRAEAARDKAQQGGGSGPDRSRAGQRVPQNDKDRVEAARRNDQRAKDAREAKNQDNADRAGAARNNQQRAAAAREAAAKKNQIVSDVTRRVRDHRVRSAEMDRLEKVFADRGDREKVARVQALRKKESDNFASAMKRYEAALGEKDFARLRQRLRLDGAQR